MKKPTIHELEQQIGVLKGERDELRANLRGATDRIVKSEEAIADLKKRLHAAETSNQFMRGYLSRVQEDDVVREELVVTGEPDGEQHMVPKRKPTQFPRPNDFSSPEREDGFVYSNFEDRSRKSRHWVTY